MNPIVYCPDFDTGVIPGAITDMSYWAPLYSGSLGSAGIYNLWSAYGNAAILAKVFPQVDGTQRLLVFSNESWDEYSSTGVRTNRHTPSTPNDAPEYDAEAPLAASHWGNMIIVTNYRDAIQKSTGAGFSALGDNPPKARLIATNANHVMLGDTDDGSTPYGDEVYWSALQNPEEWTPDIATGCGRIRLLDTPGNLTQLVAFRDKFYAFKRDSFYQGTPVGPPFLFEWRVVSSRVGATGQPGQGVVELDDKLYWVHQSGLYEFDGAGLRNVGTPVWRTVLDEVGFTGTPESGTGVALSKSRLVADTSRASSGGWRIPTPRPATPGTCSATTSVRRSGAGTVRLPRRPSTRPSSTARTTLSG